MRKNLIKGIDVRKFTSTLRDNTNLLFLDLKDNELDERCGNKIIDHLEVSHYIADIVTDGNDDINQ